MSYIAAIENLLIANRERTLETVTALESLANAQAALRWQPGAGRAHIGWQLMHIGITEELFATERLLNVPAGFAELRERFQRGSTPDANVPSVSEIREVLSTAREHLLVTLRKLNDADLDLVPEGLAARGWTLRKALQILVWHEAHHQGQAHLTLNLWKAVQV